MKDGLCLSSWRSVALKALTQNASMKSTLESSRNFRSANRLLLDRARAVNFSLIPAGRCGFGIINQSPAGDGFGFCFSVTQPLNLK